MKNIRTEVDSMRELLAIDKHSLDTEIEQQPSLFFKAGELSTKAIARRDFLKEKLAILDAKLYTKYSRLIEKKGGRTTEGSITKAITEDARHQKAQGLYLESKEIAELAFSLKEAFHQRSYMLRDQASLFMANYYERDSVNTTSSQRQVKANRAIKEMKEKRREVTGSRKSMRVRQKE